MRIEIGLLPRALHGRAPRTLVSAKSWRRISEEVRKGGRCEICGAVKNLHAHEEYEVTGDLARLSGLSCVCRACHDVIHIGRMFAIGREERAIARFMSLNGIDRFRAEDEIARAFDEWSRHPGSMRLDWSLLAEKYAALLNESEISESLASKAQR